MDKIKIILLVILLFMQYITTLIFKSDIPMNITNEDIICSLFIVSLIQTITMIIDKNYKNLLRILIIFFIVWLIDTIHLINFIGEKNYILNIIGIYPISINLVYCICKLKSVKIKK